MIYLDAAATTPIHPEVLKVMMPYLTTEFGNPNSIHSLGTTARKAVDKAREQVANAVGASPRNIIFTSGGSEANNLAIKGWKINSDRHRKIYTSQTEHTSSIRAAIESNLWYGLDSEFIDFRDTTLKDIDDNIVLGSLLWCMHTNNEIGFHNPVYAIGDFFKDAVYASFGTDCVQAFGFDKIDVEELHCDFLTISAHKIHGPKGVGALCVREPESIDPLISGGVNQEWGLRGGTENVAGIVGFGKACEIAEQNREENRAKILYLRNLFVEKLDGLDYKLNYDGESKILSVQFPGIDSETLVVAMSSMGVAISSGSACRNKESRPNGALLNYGLTEEEARSTVRISFMETNNEKEIMHAAGLINKAVCVLNGRR